MCGIAGVVRPGGLTDHDRRAASRFGKLLAHRGPDGSGTFEDHFCALTQTRLALVGPATCDLPVSSAGGRYTIVYNGEVYNFRELRRDLEANLSQVTCTDIDVVLAAWIRWGCGALERMNGMFAFFIWDSVEHRGFAACDPLGIKPFLFHHRPGYFAFASEAGVLISSGAIDFSPADEAIAESLTAPYFSSAVELPISGLRRLPPGSYLELIDGRLEITQYFHFHHARNYSEDADHFVDRVAAAVTESVVDATRAQAPVGVFLSGGVDSSLLAAIAQLQTPRVVPSWTIVYDDQELADYSRSLIVKSADAPYAERVAARHSTDHTMVRVGAARYDTALVETLRANDLICAWEQEISQHLLAEAAARRVKAVLVGDAADETHFGYSFLLNPDRIVSPRKIIEFFGTVPLRAGFLRDPLGYFTEKYRRFAESRGYSWKTPFDQRLAMSCLIYHLWLTRLLHNGDTHLMRHSLEGRVPFGDRRLLALAQSLPQELGYRDGIEKWHLRRAAERYLDHEIAWRPKSALTKNLFAHEPIHRHFVRAWREWGASIERYVDCDAVGQLTRTEPVTEVEAGIRFRLLAVMSWFARFSGAHA